MNGMQQPAPSFAGFDPIEERHDPVTSMSWRTGELLIEFAGDTIVTPQGLTPPGSTLPGPALPGIADQTTSQPYNFTSWRGGALRPITDRPFGEEGAAGDSVPEEMPIEMPMLRHMGRLIPVICYYREDQRLIRIALDAGDAGQRRVGHGLWIMQEEEWSGTDAGPVIKIRLSIPRAALPAWLLEYCLPYSAAFEARQVMPAVEEQERDARLSERLSGLIDLEIPRPLMEFPIARPKSGEEDGGGAKDGAGFGSAGDVAAQRLAGEWEKLENARAVLIPQHASPGDYGEATLAVIAQIETQGARLVESLARNPDALAILAERGWASRLAAALLFPCYSGHWTDGIFFNHCQRLQGQIEAGTVGYGAIDALRSSLLQAEKRRPTVSAGPSGNDTQSAADDRGADDRGADDRGADDRGTAPGSERGGTGGRNSDDSDGAMEAQGMEAQRMDAEKEKAQEKGAV